MCCYVQNSPNVTSEAGTGSYFPWVCLVQVSGGFSFILLYFYITQHMFFLKGGISGLILVLARSFS